MDRSWQSLYQVAADISARHDGCPHRGVTLRTVCLIASTLRCHFAGHETNGVDELSPLCVPSVLRNSEPRSIVTASTDGLRRLLTEMLQHTFPDQHAVSAAVEACCESDIFSRIHIDEFQCATSNFRERKIPLEHSIHLVKWVPGSVARSNVQEQNHVSSSSQVPPGAQYQITSCGTRSRRLASWRTLLLPLLFLLASLSVTAVVLLHRTTFSVHCSLCVSHVGCAHRGGVMDYSPDCSHPATKLRYVDEARNVAKDTFPQGVPLQDELKQWEEMVRDVESRVKQQPASSARRAFSKRERSLPYPSDHVDGRHDVEAPMEARPEHPFPESSEGMCNAR